MALWLLIDTTTVSDLPSCILSARSISAEVCPAHNRWKGVRNS